jgi:hypothetical protein
MEFYLGSERRASNEYYFPENKLETFVDLGSRDHGCHPPGIDLLWCSRLKVETKFDT